MPALPSPFPSGVDGRFGGRLIPLLEQGDFGELRGGRHKHQPAFVSALCGLLLSREGVGLCCFRDLVSS